MRFDGNWSIENDRLVDSEYTCKTVDTAAQYIGWINTNCMQNT